MASVMFPPAAAMEKGKGGRRRSGHTIMVRKTQFSVHELAKADVITAFLQETGKDYLLYGRDALKRFRDAHRAAQRTGQPRKRDNLSVLRITVRDSQEMELLAYTVEMVKTFACLN
jgi:hypothetical protein